MFAKRLLQKAKQHHHQHQHHRSRVEQNSKQNEGLSSDDLNLQIALHYGIPLTASILAFDPIQRLLAIGTLDGRIKIIGGTNIEGLLVSPKKLPYKNLEFLINQGVLVSISNDNDIQVWDLEDRSLKFSLQWEFNITAFCTIHGTFLMYVGDDQGSLSVLKYVASEKKIVKLSYHITLAMLSEAAQISLPTELSVVGILIQPSTSGNRVLIAYQNGTMVLWDITEDHVVTVKGYSDLHLKNGETSNSQSKTSNEHLGNTFDIEHANKEICALCWASVSGSILAVGYIDGDILLWDLSPNHTKHRRDRLSSTDVIKLQLSPSDRRLPVIILHWSPNTKTNKECAGQLFIYGGDEIGAEEVLTVLNLDLSSRIDSLRCDDRADLTLNGSFADMILIPKTGISQISPIDAVFVLTNPGQLHVYDGSVFSNLTFQGELSSIRPEYFPLTVPTIDPSITAAKHYMTPIEGANMNILVEKISNRRTSPSSVVSAGKCWPVSGGVHCTSSLDESTKYERIYIAGYQDGYVRIWDATSPVLTLLYVLDGEVQAKGVDVVGGSSSVTALDFCSTNLTLAVGYESSLVRIYKIHQNSKESMMHFLSATKHEVDVVQHGDNIHCIAIVCLAKSPIRKLRFTHSGSRLAIGYKCGQVVMLDLNSVSTLFNIDDISGTKSEIISFLPQVIPYTSLNSPRQASPENLKDSGGESEVLFVLTHDAKISIINSLTGDVVCPTMFLPKTDCVAISMHIIGGAIPCNTVNQNKSDCLKSDVSSTSKQDTNNKPVKSTAAVEKCPLDDVSYFGGTVSDSLLLLACENSLSMYTLLSVLKGCNDCIQKVDLLKPCYWSTIIKLDNKEAYGVVLIYQTGTLEIRSLPDMEVIEENSLMSILRWSFKMGMDKTTGSSANGEISLVHGCELAFISLFSVNDFRLRESLPCLHDKVLAQAAVAAASVSTTSANRKNQDASSGVFGGIIKGFKGGKTEGNENSAESIFEATVCQELEKHFSRIPLSNSSGNNKVEVYDLNIDDIEIDDPVLVVDNSKTKKHSRKDEKNDRKKLFETTIDVKPRPRTHEEIITKYKFRGDANAAAAHAREKLTERQEKLQRMSEKTEELQNRAEDFKSMADELVKTMENKKFWKF